MSGGIMIKSDAMRKLSIVFFSALALSLCGATIAEAATAAPAVAKAAATAAAAKAVKTPAKTTTPPKQAVAAAKAPAKAVSYSLVSQKPKAEKKKPKKIVKIGSTPKSVDFNERRRIGQGPSIDNFQSFYSRRLGVVLASSCGGSPR